MKITRLSWAALLIQLGSTNILIDPLQNITERMIDFLGKPHESTKGLSWFHRDNK